MKSLNKKTIIHISIIIISIILIYYFLIRKEDYIESSINSNILNTYEENNNINNNLLNIENNNKIIVYITGQVKNEGIHEIKEKSRIADIIEKAGGLTEEADISSLNLAYIIDDGMKIHIPKKGEKNNNITDETNTYISKENNNGNSENINKKGKININTATQTELETLPGIGSSTALKIINYRKENGKFNNIEDIKKVNGIGESKYSKIKELIKI